MAVIKDYVAWLDEQGIECAEDMQQIYRPVAFGEQGWAYELVSVETGPAGRYILKGGSNDLLLTEKSKDAFVKYMDSHYELGVEAQAMFDHAMSKDD